MSYLLGFICLLFIGVLLHKAYADTVIKCDHEYETFTGIVSKYDDTLKKYQRIEDKLVMVCKKCKHTYW